MWSSDENEEDIYVGASTSRGALGGGDGGTNDVFTGAAVNNAEKLDLYDGLDTSSDKFLLIEMRKKLQACSAENQRLHQQNIQLVKRNEELEILCTNLENNISCLYSTAKSELARKDSMIAELQGRQGRMRR